MLAHDFKDMPCKNVGEYPLETTLQLRCGWCMKTPSKAREDGCPIHELEETGYILLSIFNPEGVSYFHGRRCLTCEGPIMGHYLRRGSAHYWCHSMGHPLDLQFSEGIDNCVFDVEGIVVPAEPEAKNGGIDDVPMV